MSWVKRIESSVSLESVDDQPPLFMKNIKKIRVGVISTEEMDLDEAMEMTEKVSVIEDAEIIYYKQPDPACEEEKE